MMADALVEVSTTTHSAIIEVLRFITPPLLLQFHLLRRVSRHSP
jgi:hypothetical protein